MGQNISDLNAKLCEFDQSTKKSTSFDDDSIERTRWKRLNNDVYSFVTENVFDPIQSEYQTAMAELRAQSNDEQPVDHEMTKTLTSIFLLLLQTVEKYDRNILEQVTNMANKFNETLPMNFLTTERNDHDLYKIFISLIKFNNENSSIKMHLTLALATGSLKEILPILSTLIFNQKDSLDVRSLFIELNNNLNKNLNEEKNLVAVSLLTSLGVFPNDNLIEGKIFNGHFIASIILIHLECENFVRFEFDLSTIDQLFSIIDRLENSDGKFDLILIYSLKLLTKQLKILMMKKVESDFGRWFDLLFSYVTSPNAEISIEASKALIYLVDLRFSSFDDRLKFLFDDRHLPHVMEQCLAYLNQPSTLIQWVERFSSEHIEFFNERREEIFLRLQNYLFIQKKTSASVFVAYVVKLLDQSHQPLIDSIFLGLTYWTTIESSTISSIFIEILPILGDFLMKKDDRPFLIWLFGRICFVLFNGSSTDSNEMKNDEILRSILFAGGIESEETVNEDNEFVLSIFHRQDRGATFFDEFKSKRNFNLQKSIEQATSEACAIVFAVYFKYFRCDATSTNVRSIFDLATRISSKMSMIKGQGGDLDEFLQRIKENSLFLLTTIKRSEMIPKIELRQIEKKTFLWNKPKLSLKLFRNAFRACRRFKRLISNEKTNVKIQLQRTIDTFLCAKHSSIEFEQLKHCLCRQDHRARVRLEVLRFISIWIEKALKTSRKNSIFRFFLRHLKTSDSNWSYFDRISATNDRWKNNIADEYFHLLKILFDSSTIDEDLRTIFSLLNYSYRSVDFQRFYRDEFIRTLFDRFVRFDSNDSVAFQWFRFYLDQLEFDDEILNFIYQKLIFNQLKLMRSNDESNLNRLLIVLLHRIETSSNIRRICSTIEIFDQFLTFYRTKSNPLTIVLALKILRHLFVSIPSIDENRMKNILLELLQRRSRSDIFNEEIFFYRKLLSTNSPWRRLATEILFNEIPSNSSLDILGGFLHSFSCGSIGEILVDEQNSTENPFALIIDVNSNDKTMFTIQKRKTNRIEEIQVEQMKFVVEVPPPTNLFDLPIENERFERIFDVFIEILENSQSKYRRQTIRLLNEILTTKNLLELFFSRPSALPIVKQLAISMPKTIKSLTKIQLEEVLSTNVVVIEDEQEEKNSFRRWIDPQEFNQPRLTNEILLEHFDEKFQWKCRGTKREIDWFKRGRLGQEEIRLVPMSSDLQNSWLIEECGTNDLFAGRIYLISENTETSVGSFTLDDIRINDGKWFFAVRLLENQGVQIGWATTGFQPSKTIEMGRDKYSWAFDLTQKKLFHQEEFSFLNDDIQIQPGDVCGCGIEIESDRIEIKYWLNGRFLGTAFQHEKNIRSSTTKCNFYPNGRFNATYFPVVTLKVTGGSISCCEWIFSPEDLIDCPLPSGYKPLRLPTLIERNYSLVRYPCHAYRIGDHRDDWEIDSNLRDFVGNQHGRPFHLDQPDRSWTISFDFECSSSIDLILIEFDSSNIEPIRIPPTKIIASKPAHFAIVFDIDEQQLTIYLNEEYQRIDVSTMKNSKMIVFRNSNEFNVKNIGHWNSALSQESIQRLFTQGLEYVAMDFDRLKKTTDPFLRCASLVLIGFDENSIRNALKTHSIQHPQQLDMILRQNINPFIKFGPSIDRNKLDKMLSEPNDDKFAEILLKHFDEIRQSISFDLHVEDSQWFSSFVSHLNVNESFNSWIQDTTSKADEIDRTFQLFDIHSSVKLNQNSSHSLRQSSFKRKDFEIHHQALISIYAQDLFLKFFSLDSTQRIDLIQNSKSFVIDFLHLFDSEDFDTRQQLKMFLRTIWTIEIHDLLKHRQLTPMLFEIEKDLISQWFQSSMTNQFFIDVFHILTEFLNELTSVSQRNLLVPILFSPAIVQILFDLFIISRPHETKIEILQLFSTNRIQLDQSKKFFFSNLFHRNPLNPSAFTTRLMKRFQIAVMDVVYLLVDDRNDNLSTSTLNNLRTAMDLIEQLKSNGVDEHFMRLINKHSSIDSLLSQPITDPFLSHLPLEQIAKSAQLVFQFNSLVEQILSLVDLSLAPGQSFLTDQLRLARNFILSSVKQTLFTSSLMMTEADGSSGTPTVRFDTVAASTNIGTQGESTMFDQAFDQLSNNAHVTFRLPTERLWLAQYLGMHSTDQGGPYRDSITRISADICSNRLPLFILCPNARTDSGFNQDRWIPNVFSPHQSIPKRIRNQYRFVGQFLGMAIRKKHFLDFKFPNLLWKQLVGQIITYEDIESIDCQAFTMINEIEKNPIDLNEFFSSMIDELHFEVLSASGETFDLIPDGKDIQITAENFKDYSRHYRQYRLNEFRRQIEFIRQGLHSVVPAYFLNLYTSDELEEAVCGKSQIDVELLKRNTNYGGNYSSSSSHIEQFWTIFSDRFNEEQKKSFLTFVWGRSTLPRNDEDFRSPFIINPYDLPADQVNGALPRSHTCSFGLDLPAYSTIEIMYERLNYAINYCSSIDGDGMINDPPMLSQLHEVDSDFDANET